MTISGRFVCVLDSIVRPGAKGLCGHNLDIILGRSRAEETSAGEGGHPMFEATVSRPHAPWAIVHGKHWTARKWKRHETALFAAIASGGAWALIVGLAAIVL